MDKSRTPLPNRTPVRAQYRGKEITGKIAGFYPGQDSADDIYFVDGDGHTYQIKASSVQAITQKQEA